MLPEPVDPITSSTAVVCECPDPLCASADRERAAVFVTEFLIWWHQAGSVFYGRRRSPERDEGLILFAHDAVQVLGGWRAARRLLRKDG